MYAKKLMSKQARAAARSTSAKGDTNVEPALLMRISRVPPVRAETDATQAVREAGEVTSRGRVVMPRRARVESLETSRAVAMMWRLRLLTEEAEWKARAR